MTWMISFLFYTSLCVHFLFLKLYTTLSSSSSSSFSSFFFLFGKVPSASLLLCDLLCLSSSFFCPKRMKKEENSSFCMLRGSSKVLDRFFYPILYGVSIDPVTLSFLHTLLSSFLTISYSYIFLPFSNLLSLGDLMGQGRRKKGIQDLFPDHLIEEFVPRQVNDLKELFFSGKNLFYVSSREEDSKEEREKER